MFANKDGKKVKIDRVEARILKSKYDQYQIQEQRERQKFQTSPDQHYYLVSTKYLQEFAQYAQSNEVDRQLPGPMNEDLFDSQTDLPKENLQEGEDYQIVNECIYEILKIRGISILQIKVRAYFQKKQKRITINNLVNLSYALIFPSTISDAKNVNIVLKKYKKLYLSEKHTVSDFFQEIREEEKLSSFLKLRGWKIQYTPIQALTQKITRKLENQERYGTYSIQLDHLGESILNLNLSLRSLKEYNLHNKYILIQCVDRNKLWIFQEPRRTQCFGCLGFFSSFSKVCECKAAFYCSQTCQKNCFQAHLKECKGSKIIKGTSQLVEKQNSLKGKVGLKNMGNTCYMNSVLQCLANTEPLTTYMLFYYEKDFETSRKTRQFSDTYQNFLKKIWFEESKFFQPKDIKIALGNKNRIFSNNNQHDTQQAFMTIMEALREELNRDRNLKSLLDKSDKTKQENIHKLMSSSIIDQLFMGMYESKIVCQTCKTSSTVYETYTNVSLPIPQKIPETFLPYYIIYDNLQKISRKTSMRYDSIDVSKWLKQAGKDIQENHENFEFFFLSLKDIYNLKKLKKYELQEFIREKKSFYLIELNEKEKGLKNRLEVPTQFVEITKEKKRSILWNKRPFFFDRDNTKVIDIYRRMADYFYNCLQNPNIAREQFVSNVMENQPFRIFLNGKSKTLFLNEENLALSQILNYKQIKGQKYEFQVRFCSNIYTFNFKKMRLFQSKPNMNNLNTKAITLQKCIQKLMDPETLCNGNEWYCPSCQKKQISTKQINLYKVPEILVFQFKRFKVHNAMNTAKNHYEIQIPTQFSMQQYGIDTSPSNTFIKDLRKQKLFFSTQYPLNNFIQNQSLTYELFATNNHSGSIFAGHYRAFVKKSGRWYDYDDYSVKQVEQDRIQTSSAYMLFYQRKKQ